MFSKCVDDLLMLAHIFLTTMVTFSYLDATKCGVSVGLYVPPDVGRVVGLVLQGPHGQGYRGGKCRSIFAPICFLIFCT